jgi:protein-disulfide isomerase
MSELEHSTSEHFDSSHLTKKERKQLERQSKILKQETQEEKEARNRLLMWGITTLVVIGICVGLFIVSRINKQTNSQLSMPISASDWSQGNKQAPVSLVEYSDFQCPACASFSTVIKQLQNDLGNNLLFVYRHFPLKNIHPHAQLAAQAAEAAGKQQKFWEMHDMLFERQLAWENVSDPTTVFTTYATELKMNKEQFLKDLNSDSVLKKIDTDVASAEEMQLDSTPTFFINGKKITDLQSYGEFRKLFENALNTTSTQK